MLIAELQQGPFAIFFPCPKLNPSRERQVTCLPAAPQLKCSGRSSGQEHQAGTGRVAVLGWGLAPSYQEAFLYLPVWSTSQEAKGEGREHGQVRAFPTAPAVWEQGLATPQGDLSRGHGCLSRTIALPGPGIHPFCPSSPPVLSSASHHLPPGCSVLATTAAYHTVLIMPITLSPGHAHQAVPSRGHCTVSIPCLSCCPSTPHPSPTPPLPYANGYKEHLIILVNCLCFSLFPPGDFLTNGV